MTPIGLMALSLVVSMLVAALGLAAMRWAEPRVVDPKTRERVWGLLLYLSAVPPVGVGLSLLLPPEIQLAEAAAVQMDVGAVGIVFAEPQILPSVLSLGQTYGAPGVLLLAALLFGLRAVLLVIRLVRLRDLINASAPASPALRRVADEIARRIAVPTPTIRVSESNSEAFLAGLTTPVLVLPADLAAAPDCPATRAVCAHELAHLKRGDHRTLWLEELLLSVLAINPLLGRVRDSRAAAREEACDALALTGADDDLRRHYASLLLATLQNSAFGRNAPALTFNSSKRIFVMHRLNAILAPAPRTGQSPRLILTGVGVLIAVAAGGGSLAVAAHREPVVVVEPGPAVLAPPVRTVVAERPTTAHPDSAPAMPVVPRTEDRPVARQAQAVIAMPVAEAPGQAVISNPHWAQPPIPQFPAGAPVGTTNVRIRLTCTAESDGGLSACSAPTAGPGEAEFAAAAIQAAQGARLSPATVDAAAPGAQVTFSVQFRMADPV